MPDPDNRDAEHAPAQPSAAGIHPLPRLVCPHCDADLTFLPTAARFCNRCGVALSNTLVTSRPGPARAEPRAPSNTRFCRPRWLFNLWCACTDLQDDGPPSAGRSAVLLAYGKSMFNLGWRYEHAIGARRNLSEAARCYWKAARLGDTAATERLGAATHAGAELPEIPPPNPRSGGTPPLASVHRPD